MKKNLPLRLLAVLALLCMPRLAYCCFEWVSFTATTTSGTCGSNLAWTFNECGESGTYYIEYSANSAPFSIIGTVAGMGAPGSGSYTYTDNYSNPAGGSTVTATVEYRIVFVSPMITLPQYSGISLLNLTGASCSLNNVSRCNTLPSGLSISGPAAICSGASGSYSLSSAVPTIWAIGSGSTLVTTSSPSFGGGVSVTNTNSTQSSATLTTDVYGCLSLSMPITLGIPAAPTQMIPNPTEEKLPPSTVAEFNSPGATTWTVSPSSDATITQGQGGDDIAVRVGTAQSGTITVKAAAADACGTSSFLTEVFTIQPGSGTPFSYHTDSTSFTAVALSMTPPPVTAVTLYPNPATGSVQVLIPPTDFTKTFIKLYDVSGRLLGTIIPSGQTTLVDLSRRAKGMYIVEIFDGKQLTTQKLVRH